jgi:hypothetical protein
LQSDEDDEFRSSAFKKKGGGGEVMGTGEEEFGEDEFVCVVS